MKNKKEEIDETTVIADMSFLERKRPFRIREKSNDPNQEPLKGENLFAYIGGVLSATLLIGMVYVIAFGIVILLMYLYFKKLNG